MSHVAHHTIDSSRYAKCHRSLQARALGHRARRDPRPRVRLRQEVPARRPVAGRRASPSCTPPSSALLSQVQGRTYANMFGLVERFIGAKVLEISREHWLGDQVALEALVRLTDEELKHQELFRRLEAMMAARACRRATRFLPQPNDVARRRARQVHLGRAGADAATSSCSRRRTTAASIEPRRRRSRPLWKDVFLFHWKEESQHAILDEMEWQREDAKLTPRAARRRRRTT